MYYILLKYLPDDGHLGCFQFLAIMNNTIVNIHVSVDVCVPFWG